jgi:hypothetical protein
MNEGMIEELKLDFDYEKKVLKNNTNSWILNFDVNQSNLFFFCDSTFFIHLG